MPLQAGARICFTDLPPSPVHFPLSFVLEIVVLHWCDISGNGSELHMGDKETELLFYHQHLGALRQL